MPVGKFVVGQKDEGFSLLLKPVSPSLIGVADGNRRHGHAADRKGFLAGFLIGDFRLDIVVTHREIGRGHDAGDHLSDRFLKERAAVHHDACFSLVDGFEEGKAHDMIPVGMSEDHREVEARLGKESISQPPDPRSGIDDDDPVILGADFDAGGIAAIPQIVFTRNRNGTSCAPAPDQHPISPLVVSLSPMPGGSPFP